jgi:hypothetical protein
MRSTGPASRGFIFRSFLTENLWGGYSEILYHVVKLFLFNAGRSGQAIGFTIRFIDGPHLGLQHQTFGAFVAGLAAA